LCGEDIDLDLVWPDPRSWTSDHIRAIGAGGHPSGPLQPAHKVCNERTGSGIERESRRRPARRHPGLVEPVEGVGE
jgi:hypothetical protein